MKAEEVAALLSASRVKLEQILVAIEEARLARQLKDPPWKREEVLHILDKLASTPGGLGISARFAKARFLLRR